MFHQIIHYGLHFIVPVIISLLFFPKRWKKVYFVFLGAMLIDLDHLIADPIFDPNRCSVGFHPLHSYYAIAAYTTFLLHPKTRVYGIALLWHIVTDQIDCWTM